MAITIHRALLVATVVLATVIRNSVVVVDAREIQISNQVSLKMAVIVHCASKDSDLGAHLLGYNDTVSWYFEPNLFGGTLFWCNAAFRDGRLSFVAYDQESDLTQLQYWVVDEKGAYGRRSSSGPYARFVAQWMRVWVPGP
ncbi:unnamed protein product [Linum tenue]|uniref:S-protein homolog n=1 Tax=Linum tenue TaxID=586396 RepID=A0AAV0ICM7_9ROSI|nr:unnamed protein product [Linum tenue]